MLKMFKHYYSKTSNRFQYISSGLAILAVAGLGSYLLIGSHAATPYFSITADSGTLSSGTVKQSCSGASDGNCVVFAGGSKNVQGFGVSIPCDLICYQTASQKDEELSDVAALGAKWVRIDLRWSVIDNTGPTQNNWSAFDDTLTRATAHGLNVLPILHSTPGWANGNHGDSYPPTNISDWSNFITQAVTHEKASLHYWEIWNEENGTSFFNGTVAQYTQLLIAADNAIKAVDPTAKVLVGGMVPQGSDVTYPTSTVNWLQGIYNNGGGGHFDIVATHPYIDGSSNSSGTLAWSGWYQMAGTTPSLRSVMAAHGDASKPIWGTEWGYNLTGYLPAPSESAIQANIGIDVANWKSYPWSGVLFWYTNRDDNTTGGYGLSLNSYPIAHRPRWTSYQAAIQ